MHVTLAIGPHDPVIDACCDVCCRAALGAAEGVSEVIKAVEGEGGLDDLAMEDDKEEFLYTAFYKSGSCGRGRGVVT